VAAIGDSFTSGQIAPYVPGSPAGCVQSTSSYAYLYDPQVQFLACSGASVEQMVQTQVPKLTKRLRVVVLTAGGDTLDLFGLLRTCVIVGAVPPACEAAIARDAGPAAYEETGAEVESLLRLVHAKAPRAQLYALGYPNPLPSSVTRSCPALNRTDFFKINRANLRSLAALVPRLNLTVAAAVGAVGGYAHYVAPFSGHDVCSPSPWFYALSAAVHLPFHPTAVGQQAMEQRLERAAGPAIDLQDAQAAS
jgi:lysophospholipase L1-like esterase